MYCIVFCCCQTNGSVDGSFAQPESRWEARSRWFLSLQFECSDHETCLVFGLLAYRYGFAACASVAKLKVEAPRPWADRSVNPQHRPGKNTDGGRRTTDDDGGALSRSLTLTCGDTEA